MSIHVVNKGKEGEREICRLLNDCLEQLIKVEAYSEDIVVMMRNVVQRNQNQSAVGGGDINLFGLSIEVKRQEQLQVPAWWRQASASAKRNSDKPVLIYRQNRKAWHVVMDGYMELPNGAYMGGLVTVSIEDFRTWFTEWVKRLIKEGGVSRV